MADMFNQFDDRLRRIEAGRTRLKRGYSLTVDRDGLIVARPRPARQAGEGARGRKPARTSALDRRKKQRGGSCGPWRTAQARLPSATSPHLRTEG